MVERNSYQFDKDLQPWELILCAVVNGCFGILAVFGNLMTILMFKIRPNLYTRRTVTLLSVAVADFLVGLDCLLYAIQFALRRNWYYYTDDVNRLELNILGMFVFATQMFPTVTSGIHLLLLTIERHASIVHPLKYRTKFTKKRALISVMVAWITGSLTMYANVVIVSIAYAVGNLSLVSVCREYNSVYTVFCFGLIFTAITVDLIILYVIMLFNSWKQKVNRQQISNSKDTMSQKYKGMMQIFFVLTFYHSFAWCPFIIASLYSQLSSSLGVYRSIFYSSFLGTTNSCVNAFVYAAKNKDFRETFKCILRGDWRVKTNTVGLNSINVSERTHSKTREPSEGN